MSVLGNKWTTDTEGKPMFGSHLRNVVVDIRDVSDYINDQPELSFSNGWGPNFLKTKGTKIRGDDLQPTIPVNIGRKVYLKLYKTKTLN